MNTVFKKPLLLIGLMTGVLLFNPAAHANFETFCDNATLCNVNGAATIGVASTVTVLWRGTLEAGSTPSPSTVMSPGGVFFALTSAGGQQPPPATHVPPPGGGTAVQLGTTFTTLSQTLTFSANGPDPLISFNEMLTVPANISAQAASLGVSQIIYGRQFSVSSNSDITTEYVLITLSPAPPTTQTPGGPLPPPPPPGGVQGALTGSGLQLTRIALRFDNDQVARIAAQDEKLTALAYLNYNNTGLLDAVWEIATPATTRGTPVFQPLQTLRQYLGAGQQAVLQSPPLPSNNLGLYFIRLRIIQPSLQFEQTFIRYVISPRAADSSVRIQTINVGGPAPGMLLAKDTAFRWQAIPGATAYQLELYDSSTSGPEAVARTPEMKFNDNNNPAANQTPVSGIVVPGNRNSLSLSAIAQQRLYPGRTYQWRVIAISKEGKILATSDLREIRTP